MGVTVRIATTHDDRALAELDAASWPEDVTVAPPQPASEPFFTRWRRPGDVLVAQDDGAGALLGYARLGPHMPLPSNAHVLHIDAVVVAAGARGRGVGAALVDAAVREANRRGVSKLGLRALSTNPTALRLYERHGFVEEARLGRELRRPNGEYADDVWMARWLREPP